MTDRKQLMQEILRCEKMIENISDHDRRTITFKVDGNEELRDLMIEQIKTKLDKSLAQLTKLLAPKRKQEKE